MLKELTNCCYYYFTGSESHYERSDELPLQFEDLPIIPKPSVVTMVTKDQEILRHWRDSFGKSVRQLTVRNQSTKDNVGTLPLYAYTSAPTVPVLGRFEDATAAVDAQPSTQMEHIEAQERDERTLLYAADSVVLLKPGYPPDLQITSPFSLGILTDDVLKDDRCYSVKVTLFLPSFDDCLTFCPRADVTIHRDAVAIDVEGAKVISSDGEKLIKLSDEVFSALVRYLHKDSDSFSEDEENDWDDFESKGCQDNFCFGRFEGHADKVRQKRKKTSTPRFVKSL